MPATIGQLFNDDNEQQDDGASLPRIVKSNAGCKNQFAALAAMKPHEGSGIDTLDQV